MSEQLYDEFGNYIGPELDDDMDEGDDEDLIYGQGGEELCKGESGDQIASWEGGSRGGQDDEDRIVLHENKKYYPDAEEVSLPM